MRHSLLGLVAASGVAFLLVWMPASDSLSAAGRSDQLPEGCGLTQVRDLYSELFDAASSGHRQAGIERIASPEEQVKGGPMPVFQIGQTVAEGKRSRKLISSNRPARLYKFLAWRSRGNGALNLLSAAVSSGKDPGVAEVVFQARIRQVGKGIIQAGGKGAINCDSGQFALWQMTVFPPERSGTSCGDIEVDARRPPKHPVTCRIRY